MKLLLTLIIFLPFSFLATSQPWSSNSNCDFTDGQQWNNGGSKGCACTWYSNVGGVLELNCAFGDCGQSSLYECVYDCNGHNGNATNNVQRQCDATTDPYCWYNGGGGSAGQLYCEGFITLPIELIHFSVIKENSENLLQWSTATELNTSHFILQNSQDGKEFTTFVVLPANGNSTQVINYNARHINPSNTINYYKLVQYDNDGNYEEFDIISVDNREFEVKIVKTMDMLGREIETGYSGPVIYLLDDMTYIRGYINF